MITEKVEAFFKKHSISIENVSFAVCFSGGADSVALLSAMCRLRHKYGFSLTAVHVNHHIRGEEANRDEDFCKKMCEKEDVSFHAFSVDVPVEARKTGCGLEETARKLRYGVFEKLKLEKNINYFLTAHHANDLCETVVFNILRGCSPSGLGGIPAVRGHYLRPFIECTRKEIMEYVLENNLTFVEDSTNIDENYTRNYIRHTLFGAFGRINPNFMVAISRLSESARQDEDYFRCELDKITYETDLSLLHPAISSREICKRYEAVSNGEGLGAVHVKQIMRHLSSTEEKCIDVPFGIKGYVKNGKVRFIHPLQVPDEKIRLFLGENIFGEKVLITLENKYEKIKRFSDSPLKIVLCRDKIKGELFARRRAEGDSFKCRGFTRSVNKELINSKVPKHIRNILPIICDNEGIVFVPFVGADDRVFLKGFNTDPVTLTIDLNTKGNSL